MSRRSTENGDCCSDLWISGQIGMAHQITAKSVRPVSIVRSPGDLDVSSSSIEIAVSGLRVPQTPSAFITTLRRSWAPYFLHQLAKMRLVPSRCEDVGC